MSSSTGRVLLAATPLGNPSDASARLVAALAGTPVVAAEDTRRVQRLASDLGLRISGRVLSFFEGNESGRVPQLLELLAQGQDVLVVTDAGMPSVSDPGYRLVVAALEAGHDVTVLPGPSAVTTALALSGLPVDRFCFEGFLPRKPGPRARRIRELAAETRTLVFFESTHRVADALADLASGFGPDRPAALCRELTKTYEEVLRLPLGELARQAAETQPRGEITLVVAGAPDATDVTDDVAGLVSAREAGGMTRKEAIAAVVTETGLSKRVVFDAVVAAKPRSGMSDLPDE